MPPLHVQVKAPPPEYYALPKASVVSAPYQFNYYVVWVTPGSSEDIAGVHCGGAKAWREIASRLGEQRYKRGLDHLTGHHPDGWPELRIHWLRDAIDIYKAQSAKYSFLRYGAGKVAQSALHVMSRMFAKSLLNAHGVVRGIGRHTRVAGRNIQRSRRWQQQLGTCKTYQHYPGGARAGPVETSPLYSNDTLGCTHLSLLLIKFGEEVRIRLLSAWSHLCDWSDRLLRAPV